VVRYVLGAAPLRILSILFLLHSKPEALETRRPVTPAGFRETKHPMRRCPTARFGFKEHRRGNGAEALFCFRVHRGRFLGGMTEPLRPKETPGSHHTASTRR
jgi:hypothetical protein